MFDRVVGGWGYLIGGRGEMGRSLKNDENEYPLHTVNKKAMCELCKTLETGFSDYHQLTCYEIRYFQRAISEKSFQVLENF